MGLDFGKSSMGNPAQAGNGLQEKNEIEVVEKYDIVADRQQMNAELVNSKEVDDIVSTIEVYNMDTIVSFGAKAAEEISKASDVVLNSMNMSQLNETSEMLKSLAKIMDQFDINEIKDNPGLFGKLFEISENSWIRYWPSITQWAKKLIRFMFSLKDMSLKSNSPTKSWIPCLRPMWIIIMNW